MSQPTLPGSQHNAKLAEGQNLLRVLNGLGS
jgi:hypothetical protein